MIGIRNKRNGVESASIKSNVRFKMIKNQIRTYGSKYVK